MTAAAVTMTPLVLVASHWVPAEGGESGDRNGCVLTASLHTLISCNNSCKHLIAKLHGQPYYQGDLPHDRMLR